MTQAATPSVTFAAGSACVRVACKDAAVLDAARLMFPEFITQPTTDARELLVLREDDGGFTVGEQRLSWGALVEVVEHWLARSLLLGFDRHHHLHAAGITLPSSGTGSPGVGALLLGPSGAGKSTLAVRALLDGLPLLGDDVVLVDEQGTARSFYRRPKIDANQAPRFDLPPSQTTLWQPDADECWLDPNRWAGWSPPVPIRVVAQVRHRSGVAFAVTGLSPSEVLSALVGATFPTVGEAALKGSPDHESLFAVAERCTGLRIEYSEARDALAEVRKHLCAAQGQAPV